MKWTEDQEKSIFASPSQIVVSAAAGSGKTQVLTTRIIERIKNTSSPVSVEKLLIVTFTKAAAAEMKERIGKALRNAANNETDASVRKYLKNQLSLLGSAHICTIDSFCYDIVKQNFFKVDLPSDISIGETGELSLLKLSALEETVDALYCALEKCKGTPLSEENMECALIAEKYFPNHGELEFILNGFEALTNTCSYDKRDSDFSENSKFAGDYSTMISDLYKKSQSAAYPEKWLNSAAEMYNTKTSPYKESILHNYVLSKCKTTLNNAITALNNLANVSRSADIGYEISLEEDISVLTHLTSFDDYDGLRNAVNEAQLFPNIKGKKRGCDVSVSESIKDGRNFIKETIKSTFTSLLEFSLEECESLLNQLYPQIKALCSAAILMGKIYYEKMISRRIIDFSTCEHLALKIISEDSITLSETGETLKNKFDEIYIDEIQDSNELQDTLFSLISNGRSFMVGDVKQSIYGFRNADPSIFMKKCEDSSFDEDAAKRKIFLSKNFRSGKSIIEGVNSIFDVVMTPEVCGIDYKKEHRLDFGTDFMPESIPGEKCEISIIQKVGKSPEQLFNEADYVAKEIKRIVTEGRLIFDKEEGKQRPVEYRDIAVLARSLKSASATYEAAFLNHGIPCYIDGNDALYETNEVGQILEILKLIDNEQSDISLACALRSPMFMFDENELLKIKLASDKCFYDSFYGICSGEYKAEPALAKKCRNFKKYLNSWRDASGFVSVEELIRRIYNDTGIYSSVLSFPDGQIRRANLDLLLDKAEEFERSSYNGLFNFVNYVQKIKKTSENISEAKAVSEKMNVVRILTIHKSKGLEFPIVFVLNCAKKYKSPSMGAGGLIMNSYAGIGMNVINPILRCKYKSPMQSALVSMAKRDNTCEEMRLFYVALTRAREKLYVVATLGDYDGFEKLQHSAFSSLSSNEILAAQSYISMVALAYARGADRYWKATVIIPDKAEEFDQTEQCLKSEFEEDREISKLLEFEYPYKDAVSLPNKASVSVLKSFDINLAPAEDGSIPLLNAPSCKKVALNKPDFHKKGVSGTFFGTVHHKFLQYIDYNGAPLSEQLDILFEKGIITKEEYDVIQIDKIEAFLQSSMGQKLKNAKKIYREEPFVISISAGEINPILPIIPCSAFLSLKFDCLSD